MNVYDKIRTIFNKRKKKTFIVKKIWYVEAENAKDAVLKSEEGKYNRLEVCVDEEGECNG